MSARPIVVGLAGGSGSGKTTVLRRLMERFGTEHVAVVDHDSYYLDLVHLAPERRAKFNFDHPDALETELLIAHLDELLEGKAIEKPVYDFTGHVRSEATTTIEPRPIVIVEGILVLSDARLRDRMQIKLFVEAADDIRLIRRIRRDINERGRAVDDILSQYERTVRPMHHSYVEPSRNEADIIIPRGGHNTVAIDLVVARLAEWLRTYGSV